MRPFSVRVEDAVLDDLARRLRDTRWPDAPPGARWEHGSGVPVLFLHGWPSTVWEFHEAEVLARSVRDFAAAAR